MSAQVESYGIGAPPVLRMPGATRSGISRVVGRDALERLGVAVAVNGSVLLSRVGPFGVAVAPRAASARAFVGTEAGSMSPNSATACSYGMPAAIASTTTERPLAA